MGAKHASRIWAAAGAFGAIVLLAVGWFLLIGPQKDEAEGLRDQVTASHDQAVSLQRTLADLREQQRNLPRYKAELEADRKALPAFPSTTDLVRQLRAAGTRSNVTVTTISIGDGQDQKNTGVFEMPISITASGAAPRLEDFLNEIQRVQPRALLVKSVAISEENEEQEGEDAEAQASGPPTNYSLNISVSAFVAPAADGGGE